MRLLLSLLLLGSFAFAQGPAPDYSKLSAKELEVRADAFRSQKDTAAALQLYNRAIAKDRKNAVLYNKVGMALLSQGQYEPARRSFEKATKLNKEYPEAINNLAVIYYQRKDYRKAIQLYRKAIAMKPDSASFHLNLGSAYFDDKKMESAMNEYSQALRLDPDVFDRSSAFGISAKVARPQDRAIYAYMMARLYARANDVEHCLTQLRRAMENGYTNINDVYQNKEFAVVRQDPRFAELMQAAPVAVP